MKKTILAVACMFFAMCVGLAGATPYTYVMGGGSSIDASKTTSIDDYLMMAGTIDAGVYGLTFALNVGESKTFAFASIGTNEIWINDDDLNPGEITAYLDFADPSIMAGVLGISVGFTDILYYEQGWTLTWADPVIVDFGNGGQFEIRLSDASHSNIPWNGPTGFETVYATVKHLADPVTTPIPEPATILLVALGLTGLAGIRRKC